MTEFLLKNLPSGGDNCMVCNKGNTYRIPVYDPENRLGKICVECLVEKMCKQIKGGICNGFEQPSKGNNPEGSRQVSNDNRPSQGSNTPSGGTVGKPVSQGDGKLPEQIQQKS